MPFADKLRLVLKVLSMSRARLAFELGVDKSLVGRWAAGTVRPSEHNLARLTTLIAQSRPGFTMIDWERDMMAFAALLGVAPSDVQRSVPASETAALHASCLPYPPSMMAQARLETERRGGAYEGFWRTSRASVIMEGTVFHDHGMVRRVPGGLLEVRMGGAGLLFEGWMMPSAGNLFVTIYDAVGGTPLFLVFRGVALPKADLLDGILLLSALNPQRTPAAIPILMERIGDLSGDPATDDARCQELLARDPRARIDDMPQAIRDHLIRDIGPEAAAQGGDLFLVTGEKRHFSRGATLTGELKG